MMSAQARTGAMPRTTATRGAPRIRIGAWVLPLVLGLVLLAGCSAGGGSTTSTTSGTPAGGGMGMGGGGGGQTGGTGGQTGGMGSGVVADAKNASMKVARQPDSGDHITIAEVVAPADGWIVARSSLAPGGVLGAVAVHKGRNSNVQLKLDRIDNAAIRLALHVDRGKKGKLEFDPAKPERSRDKPVFARNGKAVEKTVSLKDIGSRSPSHELLVDDQPGAKSALKVQVIATKPSWVSVSTYENGFPGKLLGSRYVTGEQFQIIEVRLETPPPTEKVVVLLHSDTGAIGTFDYRFDAPLGSPDQPYRLGDALVSQVVRVR